MYNPLLMQISQPPQHSRGQLSEDLLVDTAAAGVDTFVDCFEGATFAEFEGDGGGAWFGNEGAVEFYDEGGVDGGIEF
jgi:hypothetical protein